MQVVKNTQRLCAVIIAGLLLSIPVHAQDIMPAEDDVTAPKQEYSPYVDDHFPNRVFFGDTHLHKHNPERIHSARSEERSVG